MESAETVLSHLKEAQSHSEIETSLFACQFLGFQCYFSYRLRERFSIEFINNFDSLHLAPELADLFLKAHSFLRATLSENPENCSPLGTDNVSGQVSEHVFAPNGGYCVYYPSNIVRHARSFENWGISLRYSPALAGI